ncbi:hypothetical protein Nmel_015329 [Mimus melanotis]
MQPGCPIHSTPGRQKLQKQLQRQLPDKPLLSHPAMECRAEINRFAIFLFCLLAPLGSMAPTETSESKVTAEARLNHFTTEIPTYAAVIHQKAQELLNFYNNCIHAIFHCEPQTVQPEVMAERIPMCQAFQANCCALHHIQNNLQALEREIETICSKSSRDVVQMNLNQLSVMLGQGTVFYSCRSQDLPQVYPQIQSMNLAQKKNYIWQVLQKYENITQSAEKLYS